MIVRTGRYTFLYPKTLYNIERFELKLKAIGLLAQIGSQGKDSLTMSDVPQQEKVALWEFFRKGGFADQLGPVFGRGSTKLVVRKQNKISLTSGGRTITIRDENALRSSPSTLAIPAATPEEVSAYKAAKALSQDETDRGTSLSFRFLTKQGSVEGMEAIEAFSVHLQKRLQAQNEQYERARAQLMAAFKGVDPAIGSKFAANPSLMDTHGDHIIDRWSKNGFRSASEARAFLSECRVTSIDSEVYLGFYQRVGERIDSFYQSTKVLRFGGP